MLLSNGFGRRALDDSLNLGLIMEAFQVIVLEESNQLPECHQVVQHDHFLLPSQGLLFLIFDPLIEIYDYLGQVLLEIDQRLVDFSDIP